MNLSAEVAGRRVSVPAAELRPSLAVRLLPLLTLAVLVPFCWFPWRWPAVTLLALPVIPALLAARWWRNGAREHPARPTGLEWPLAGLLLATALAALPVTDWQLALPKLLGMVLGVAAVVTIGEVVSTRRLLGYAVVALAALTVLLVGVGLVGVEWVTSKYPVLAPLYAWFPTLIRGVPNSRAGGINPNQLGGMLVLLLPVLLAQIFVPAGDALGRVRRFGGSAAGLLGVGVLLLTQSRSALAGASIALAVLGGVAVSRVARRRHWPRAVRVLVPLGYLTAVAIAVVVELRVAWRWMRSVSASTVPLDTLDGRLELWHYGLRLLGESPVLGIGIGQIHHALRARYDLKIVLPNEYIPHVHNLFLEYALELGALGLVSFVWLLAASFRRCWEAARAEDRLLRWTSLGLLLGIVAHVLFGLTDALAPGARGGLLFWVIVGLALASAGIAGRTAGPAPSQPGQTPRRRTTNGTDSVVEGDQPHHALAAGASHLSHRAGPSG